MGVTEFGLRFPSSSKNKLGDWHYQLRKVGGTLLHRDCSPTIATSRHKQSLSLCHYKNKCHIVTLFHKHMHQESKSSTSSHIPNWLCLSVWFLQTVLQQLPSLLEERKSSLLQSNQWFWQVLSFCPEDKTHVPGWISSQAKFLAGRVALQKTCPRVACLEPIFFAICYSHAFLLNNTHDLAYIEYATYSINICEVYV